MTKVYENKILQLMSARPSLERFGEKYLDNASTVLKNEMDLENMGAARILLIRIELSTHVHIF